MSRIHETIEVDVPISTAYNQWTQFEQFPEFMEGVERVEQLDDTTLRWTASIAGKTKEWTAKITDQTPDRRVAWAATEGAQNDGAVSFTSAGPDRTRIDLDLDVEPEGMLEQAGDALGFVQRRAKGDLERFKEYIESRGRETGEWRGEVKGGQKTNDSGYRETTGVGAGMGTGAGTLGTTDQMRGTTDQMRGTDMTGSTYEDPMAGSSSTGHGTIGSAGSTGYGGAGIRDETETDR